MNIATLNKVEKKFLAGYCPENDMFTSQAEIKTVRNTLSLEAKSSTELMGIRNAVVDYYSNRMELTENKKEVMNKWMSAMQSVTSVIDDIMVKKYGRL